MAKIVLYSGGETSANQKLHSYLTGLAGPTYGKSVTYIPSCYLESEVYYQRFKKKYSRFGVTEFHRLFVDQPLLKADIDRALKSDIIYLDGGNTFYFLKHLRDSGMLKKLRQFARKGGVLGGLSAGAILMTPNIGLAAYPEYDADENEVDLKDLSSLNLTDFEFYPHYEGTARDIQSLKNYTRRTGRPVYAATDGSGIIVNGSQRTFVGRVDLYFEGQSVSVCNK